MDECREGEGERERCDERGERKRVNQEKDRPIGRMLGGEEISI